MNNSLVAMTMIPLEKEGNANSRGVTSSVCSLESNGRKFLIVSDTPVVGGHELDCLHQVVLAPSPIAFWLGPLLLAK
jgi:hypothetical protein